MKTSQRPRLPSHKAILAIVAVLLALTSATGLCGQSATRSIRSDSQAAPARIPLEIYNFDFERPTDDPQWAEGLQTAVSDSLLLQFLGHAEFDSRRIRETYKPSAISGGDSSLATNQSTAHASEGRLRYVLDGRLTVVEPPGGTLTGDSSSSGGHILVLRCWLREIGNAQEPKILLDVGETMTLSRLPTVIMRLTEQVITQLAPPSKITVMLLNVDVEGSSRSRQSFYSDNLLALLQAEAQGTGWIEVVGPESKAQYSVSEKATLQNGQFMLEATILSPELQQSPRSLRSSGPQEGVLTAQLALARQVVEALDLERQRTLLRSRSDKSGEPSAEEYIKAASAYDESNPDVAIPLYRRALELDPLNLTAKVNLARTYLHKQDALKALKILEGSDVDSSPPGQMMRSFAYALLGRPNKALEAANLAVQLGPRLAVAYWWRGRVKEYAGDLGAALSDYQKALELAPESSDYYEDVAHAFEELNNYSAAEEVLGLGRERTDQKEKLSRLQNDVRRRAALNLIQSNQGKKALPFAEKAAREEPNSELSQRVLGMTYHVLGRMPESDTALKRALQIEETSDTLAEMASLRFDQNQIKPAYDFAVKSIQKDPERSQAYGVLSSTAAQLGLAEQTVSFLADLWKAHPHSFQGLEVWDWLQLTYLSGDQAGLNSLYAAYESTLQTVAYKDWTGGWANMVELALISGNSDRAANIAQDMLGMKPSQDYAVTLSFYLWVTRTVQGDCVHAQTAWNAFVGYLSDSKADGLQLHWSFEATDRFVKRMGSLGRIPRQTLMDFESALKLLGEPALSKNVINRFLTAHSASAAPSCP